MKALTALLFLVFIVSTPGSGQEPYDQQEGQSPAKLPLDVRIAQFDITDAILRDGLSDLSMKKIDGLHLGFEEIIRNRIQDDPRGLSSHFSLHLKGNTVRQILDALCDSDVRYTWSQDGASVNIYPKDTESARLYLLNLQIERMALNDIPDPDQSLTTLSHIFPNQQVGYFGPGLGDNAYAAPWTAVFEHLAVRQFVNRIAEHMGPQTIWVWEGGQQERMFTFLKGGFHTFPGARTPN